jgi:glycerate kinase
LKHYAQIIKKDLGIDVEHVPGAGAAGGMGAALYGFCHAELRQGIEIVTEALGLDALVRDATLVITGEGRIDSQSINGKVPIGVARVAKRYNKPVIAIGGSLTQDVDVVYEHGLDAVFSVLYSICTLEEALDNAADNLRKSARNIAATIRLAQKF